MEIPKESFEISETEKRGNTQIKERFTRYKKALFATMNSSIRFKTGGKNSKAFYAITALYVALFSMQSIAILFPNTDSFSQKIISQASYSLLYPIADDLEKVMLFQAFAFFMISTATFSFLILYFQNYYKVRFFPKILKFFLDKSLKAIKFLALPFINFFLVYIKCYFSYSRW